MRISDWSSDVCSSDLLRSDYTAQGPTVNLAARIEQLCEPGRVYVSHATAQLLEGYCRLRALGDRKRVVEGKSVSVRVDLGGGRIIKKDIRQQMKLVVV